MPELPPAPRNVECTLFPGGKRIAVTTSFDDGDVFDRRIVRAFNEWGLKGTFNLNSGSLGRSGKILPDTERGKLDVSEVAELYAGHEVAIHTVSHPHLPRLDAAQIARQVMEDRVALEEIVGYPVRGMAYPFGTHNQRVMDILRHLGVVYCRTCVNLAQPFPPADPLAFGTTCHQYNMEPPVAERFQQILENERFTGVFYVWGHGFEFHDRQDWDGLERIYKPLSGHHDQVWYATNIELFDYEEARQRMRIAANRRTAQNPSAIPVTLRVDGALVEVAPGETKILG